MIQDGLLIKSGHLWFPVTFGSYEIWVALMADFVAEIMRIAKQVLFGQRIWSAEEQNESPSTILYSIYTRLSAFVVYKLIFVYYLLSISQNKDPPYSPAPSIEKPRRLPSCASFGTRMWWGRWLVYPPGNSMIFSFPVWWDMWCDRSLEGFCGDPYHGLWNNPNLQEISNERTHVSRTPT